MAAKPTAGVCVAALQIGWLACPCSPREALSPWKIQVVSPLPAGPRREMVDRPRGCSICPVGSPSDLDTWHKWELVTVFTLKTHEWAQSMQPSRESGSACTHVARSVGTRE